MDKIFEILNKVNVNEYTEKKNGLTYLTWSMAWQEVKKLYPQATYNIKKFENNLPYIYDEKTGYMVFTDVTIEGLTYEMWLPVMDGSNKSLKDTQYTIKSKYGDKIVEQASMFDINKTIMRCLVKNLAMFGLGLYVYNGDDLPEGEEVENKSVTVKKTTYKVEEKEDIADKKEKEELITTEASTLHTNPLPKEDIADKKEAEELITTEQADILYTLMKTKGLSDEVITDTLFKKFGVNTVNELTVQQRGQILVSLSKIKEGGK